MHGTARLVLYRLGHKGGKAVMPMGRLADQPFEIKDLIGEFYRIAMAQVDLDLPRAAFL